MKNVKIDTGDKKKDEKEIQKINSMADSLTADALSSLSSVSFNGSTVDVETDVETSKG